jgi:hypothetical protein
MNKYTDSNIREKTNTRLNVHTIFEIIEKLNVWGETNNLKNNGSNKTKHKQDRQNRLRSPMSEGGES